MATDTRHLEFRFFDPAAPEAHRVPARVLADALTHAQRAVHLLAMQAAGREIRQRARIPAEITDHFVLECEVPSPGSYAQRVTLRGDDRFAAGGADGLLARFGQIGAALGASDWDAVRGMVPERGLRNRLIDEYVAMLPDPEERWSLDLQNGRGTIARFDARQIRVVREFHRRLREPAEPFATPIALVGALVAIDFAERKLVIRHHPTNRRLECEYGEDVEEMLVENRRGPIRVSGLVELDANDLPIRLTDVFDIQEIDLSPLVLERVQGAVRRLRFRGGPRTVPVRLDDEGHLLVAEDAALDVHVFAPTRGELAAELVEQIEMLWLEYAEAEDVTLTPGAVELARMLREQVEIANDDSQAE